MKPLNMAIVGAAILAAVPALAEPRTTSPGASGNTPAQDMKDNDATGASQYTPGYKMKNPGPNDPTGPGASEYAPGQQDKNTGSDSGSSGPSSGTRGNK